MPTKRTLFNVYILVLRASEGVRLCNVLLNRADDCRNLQQKTRMQDITLAQAYWLFVKPGLELTGDLPDDPDLPVVLDFFRRAAPPSMPPDLGGLCWQPRLALAGALPLGRVHQSVRIQGLVAKPHFNNLTGLVEGVHDTGRIIVSLHLPYNGTEALTLKPENLEVLDWPPVTPSAMQFAVGVLRSDSAVKTKSTVAAGTELEVVGCLTLAGMKMEDELSAEVRAFTDRAESWFLSTACLGVLGFTGPAEGRQAMMHPGAREKWQRTTLTQLTMAMREAGHQWVLMRLLMVADHTRLLCLLRGEKTMSRLWAIHRDWVLLSYLRPAMTEPAMVTEPALVSEAALAAIGVPLSQHQIIASRAPAVVRWFATHPGTLASLPIPSSAAVPPSGQGSALPPAPPGGAGGLFFEDPDVERRVALACGASSLIQYLVLPPTHPDHWRRSEFAASHCSIIENIWNGSASEDNVVADFMTNFDATSMADSCCSLMHLMTCFLEYRLRAGYDHLFWSNYNCLTQHLAVVSALSVPARDRLHERLREFSPVLLHFPAENEGMITRDKIARELQAHLESSEFSSDLATQVAAHSARALEFLCTRSREFFFKHVLEP